MTPKKKQALQKILEALVPHWHLAEWFLLLLQEGWNDELEGKLYQNILREIRNINSESQQENMKTALERLKENAEIISKRDEKDAEEMLNDFIDNLW